MHVFELARRLIDIPSITPNEKEVVGYLFQTLDDLARRFDGRLERMPVEQGRDNLFASFGHPVTVLSTHTDTVPPFIPSSETNDLIYGRGACDTKGIIASMIAAAEQLLQEGVRDFGLLFVVGEERNSAGAEAAARNPRGARFLINGEPTENKLALGSKGALRFEIVARGRMAHSAYPELGDSAITKLLAALERVLKLKMPVDSILGASTLNIGTIAGGRAPNVIPDEAQAEVFIRVVGDVSQLRAEMQKAARPDAEAKEVLFIPAIQLGTLEGFESTVVAFTTDIPAFDGAWGKPFLIGPGSIHVAHTAEEHVPKSQLTDAIRLYKDLVKRLAAQS